MKMPSSSNKVLIISVIAPLITILAVLFIIIPEEKVEMQSMPLAEFAVHAGKYERLNIPVSASLEGIPLHPNDGELRLYEITGGTNKPVPSQIKPGNPGYLTWILAGKTLPGQIRNYELRSVGERKRETDSGNKVLYKDDGESIRFSIKDNPVLEYRYALKPVPDGVDEIFSRGGYIHPLWSPAGEILSRIQPPDHYHHYGIWNPWARTEFEGREVDFWNLWKGEGTVRAQTPPERHSGEVFGGFRGVHEHIDFTSPEGEKTALDEQWEVIVWNADPEGKTRIIDFVSVINPPADQPFTIKQNRYQGFSLRATEKWGDDTAMHLSSEGKNKSNANETRARWIDVNGISDTEPGTSGILIMTNPGNHAYPEFLRIWPIGFNEGKENVFINFNPTQETDWRLEPGKSYTLRYRMYVYDGKIDSLEAERHWRDFADPPKIDVFPTGGLHGANILVYIRTGEGYVHDNIDASVMGIKRLGERYGFSVTVTDDPDMFTPGKLGQYDALIFSNTNENIFDNDSQREALQHYIRGGGSFVGIHSVSTSESDWTWFVEMVGGKFVYHPPQQDFTVEVTDRAHPSTSFLSDRWEITDDECYYHHELSPRIRVLLSADLKTVTDDRKEEFLGGVFNRYLPVAWYQEFDGGRQWFTSLGHRPEHYDDELFLRHILGGIQWAVNGGPR